MMYTPAEIEQIRAQARRLHLRAPRRFGNMPATELARIANGYGPERWPDKARKLLTWIFRHYPAPAAIHDLRYEFSNGRAVSRYLADAELAANLLIAWKARYGRLRWFKPVAIYAYFKVRAAAVLTAELGVAAWREAFHKRHIDERSENHGKSLD